MDLDFNAIEKIIKDREDEIRAGRQQISAMIMLNDQLQVIADPDNAEDAKKILERIRKLKAANAADNEFCTNAKKLLAEHVITQTAPGIVGFGELVGVSENSIYYGKKALGARFVAGEMTSAEYEAQLAELRKPHDARIAELKAVESHIAKMRPAE